MSNFSLPRFLLTFFRKNIYVVLLLACIFPGMRVSAQQPVQVIVSIPPPASVRLSDYYSGITPKIIVNLLNKDLSKSGLSVYMKVTIAGSNGVYIETNTEQLPPIILDGGFPKMLTTTDIAPYFNLNNLDFKSGLSKDEYLQNGMLPEGFYTFKVEVFETTTQLLLGSATSNTANLVLPSPPLLTRPFNKSDIKYSIVTNVIFSWTPVLTALQGYNTTYTLQMIELWDKAIDPQSAFESRQPTWSTTTNSNQYIYTVNDPPLLPGKTYAWRVIAKSTTLQNQAVAFANNGYSMAFSFTYANGCAAPDGIAPMLDDSVLSLSWMSIMGIDKYIVEYRIKDGNDTWTQIPVSGNYVTITGLERKQTYEYRIGGDCNTGSYTFSAKRNITIPAVKVPFYTVTGRLLDQERKAVPGAKAVLADDPQYEATTSAQGFWSLKVPAKPTGNISIIGPNMEYVNVPFTAQTDTKDTLTVQQWKLALQNSTEAAKYISQGKTIDARVMGVGNCVNGDFQTCYTSLMLPNEVFKQVIDKGEQTMTLGNRVLNLSVSYPGEGGKVAVKIYDSTGNAIPNTIVKIYDSLGNLVPGATTLSRTQVYKTGLPPGTYAYEIKPVPGDIKFTQRTGYFNIVAKTDKYVTVSIVPGVGISGKVTSAAGTPIANATVEANGLPYSTTTDTKGDYSLTLPSFIEIPIKVTANGFNAKDTAVICKSDGQMNFVLTPFLNSGFTTLSGYPITITKCTQNGTGSYVISGTLTLSGNGVFSPLPGQKLTFRDLTVTAGTSSTNAVPLADFAFEEATLNATAYAFMPVEISGTPGIWLRAYKDNGPPTYEAAYIGGSIKALFSSSTAATHMPFALPDAAMVPLNTPGETFTGAFLPAGKEAASLAAAAKFKIVWNTPPTPNFTPYVTGEIANNTGILDQSGISLTGFVQLPAIQSVAAVDSKIRIKKLKISSAFILETPELDVSHAKPLMLGIQKLAARLSSATLTGIGTNNATFKFTGGLYLTKGENSDSLVIQEMKVVRQSSGTSFSATLASSGGIKVKGLKFNPTAPLSFSYNSTKKSFTLACAGDLTYEKPSGATTSASSNSTAGGTDAAIVSVFPISILDFKLNTADWSLFMAAAPNLKIDLKVVKVNVDKFLVSTGSTGVSLNQMNNYILTGNPGNTGAGSSTEMVDVTNMSWALGISGGVEFSNMKGMNASAAASFVVGNVNNTMAFRLNRISMTLQQPNFHLAAGLELALGNEKRGFAADAQLTTLNKQFSAAFNYYRYFNSAGQPTGTEVGASISASVNITTGPIQWYRIGGGFNFNTNTQMYRVNFNGDIGPAGVPKETATAYVRNAYIEVLYQNGGVCNGGVLPLIISGGGKLNIRNTDWCDANASIDFCKSQFLLGFTCNVPAIPMVSLNANGTLFMMPNKLFMGLAANANILNGLMTGNLNFALGYNIYRYDAVLPYAVRSQMDAIPAAAFDGNNLNAIAIKGYINRGTSGSHGVSIAGMNLVNVSYNTWLNGNGVFYYKFYSKRFYASAGMDAGASGSVKILTFSLSGSAAAKINLSGSYNGSWSLSGSAGISLQMYNHSSAGCNRLSYPDACTKIGWPYPCGCTGPKPKWKVWTIRCNTCYKYTTTCIPDITKPRFKVCLSKTARFNYSNGQISFGFN